MLWMWVRIPPGRSSAPQVTHAPGHPPLGQGGWRTAMACLLSACRVRTLGQRRNNTRPHLSHPPPWWVGSPPTADFPSQTYVSLRLPSGSLDFPSCQSLCDPMGCSPPASSVDGILQARALERGATSRPRNGTRVSCLLPWSGLPCPPAGDLPHPGAGTASPVSCSGRWILDH